MTRACLLATCAIAASLWAATAAAEVRFQKGPYLMDVGPTHAAVLFELTEAAPATLTISRNDAVIATLTSAEGDFHEVVATGLEAGAAYTYRVEASGTTASGAFTTAPTPGEGPVRFLVAGDNRTDAQAHRAVVEAMRRQGGEFVVNTGDMVANGAVEEDWQEFFDGAGDLLRETPIFPALGNHELYLYGVGLPGFLKYTRVPSDLGGEETYYAFDWGPVRFFMLDSNDDWSDPEAVQRRWLADRLAETDATDSVAHIVVVLHHGPVSSNRHGGHPDMMSTGLLQLFRRHEVALVLSGHDHAYERGDAHGVKYIVTGGGGAPLYDYNDPLPFQHRFEASHHFLVVEADRERVEVTALRVDDTVIERCAFDRGGRWTCLRDDGPSPTFVPSEPVPSRRTDDGTEPHGGSDSGSSPFLGGAGGALLAVLAVGTLAGLAWLVARRRRG